MTKKYLIASDLDGTLLTENGQYLGFSRNYLKKLKETGHIIVIATGRTLEAVIKALEKLDFMDYIILNGGAAIYEVSSNNFIYLKEINKQELNKVLPILISNMEKLQIRNQYMSENISKDNYSEKLKKFNIITALVMNPKNQNEIDKILKLLNNTTNSIKFSIMQDSFTKNKRFNISALGVSKFNAIEWLIKAKNINAKNVITFGDGLNDLDMIEKCEIGVAVKNALPEVKQIARYVTDKPQEEGVLRFLQNFFDNDI